MKIITNTVTSLFLTLLFAQLLPAQEPVKWRDRGSNKNATFYEVQQDFYNDWQGKTPQKGQGYKVFKRWENYMAPRVYPSGDMRLPNMAYENFMKWQQESAADKNGLLPCNNWTSLGPNTIPTGYDGASGRINNVRFHPTNPNTFFVTSPDGGLWKTTNGGTSWTTNHDFLPIIGCNDLAIDPTNPQIMYLATGDKGDRSSIGILKSTNGGASWSPTSLVWAATDNYKIRRLIMHPANPQIMLIATDGGIFKTTDGWATYSQPYCCNSLFDTEFKPGDPNIVYACGSDVLRSDDAGDTWTTITSGLPVAADVSRMIMAVSPANSSYVYIIAGNQDGGYLGTYRSTNSGLTYSLQSSTPNILGYEQVNPPGNSGQAFHDLAIVVSPTDANLVTIGGISAFQSTDGGGTWTCVAFWGGYDPDYNQGQGPAEYVHADIQDLQYLPGSSTTLLATCDGGIYKSINNGGNWTKLSSNLSIAQQTSVAVSASSPTILVVGEQDIGNLKWDGTTWTYIGGGDGEDAFIHRENNSIIVSSNVYGGHELSFDGGFTRASILGLPPGEWFSPIRQDPATASTVYAGGRPLLYRKTDLFTNNNGVWETLGTPPGSGNILRFVIAPSNNSVIYAIKSDAVSKSTNAGATWTNITGTLPVGSASLTNIAVSNTNPNKVWITFSGYSAGNKVFKTTNSGTSWSNLSTGLPNLPINTIVFVNGSSNDAVYLGADIGIYYLNNSSSSWTLFNTGLPNNSVTDLEIYYPEAKLRASTYGRGAWESSICDLSGPTDNDGDGYPASNDCNDNNPNINPGATEVCNYKDDNCDGIIDNVPSGVDLVVNTATAPASAVSGATISVYGKVQNLRSTTSGSSKVRFWLSNDQIPGNSNDYSSTSSGNNWNASTNTITKCNKKNFGKSITLPSSGWTGTKYLIFVADGFFNINETNEGNNIWVTTINITNSFGGGGDNDCSDGSATAGMLDLGAVAVDRTARLNWVVAQPEGVVEMIVERAAEGTDFQPIATLENPVEAGGAEVLRYTDSEPPGGICRYRVLAMLANGTEVVSNERELRFGPLGQFSVFPNPTVGDFTLVMEAFVGKEVDVVVSDAMGRQVLRQHIDEVTEKLLRVSLPTGSRDWLYNVSVVHRGRAFSQRLAVAGQGLPKAGY